MTFEMPNAVAAMNNAIAAVGDAGECWDIIGTPLDQGVDKTLPAYDNISAVVKKGKDQLAHDWKGKSFDAFRTAIERVEKTLNDYSAAVKTTAKGLGTAMSSIRTQ